MQPQRPHGLPPRPSFSHPSNSAPQPWAQAARALSSALANPYTPTQSAHYAQAYAQYYAGQQATPQGYTYSATYTPGPADASTSYGGAQPGRGRGRAPSNRGGHQQQQHWYSAGSSRCSNPGCGFTGSAKAVETHMMDRHLIYPPGWDKRKRKSDWDADPSLKGKPVPIQGTSIRLETPADIEKWIEERKRRWPTAERVDEKKRKLDEAIARGQIYPDDQRNKRRRLDDGGGGESSWGDRGRGRGRGTDRGWGAERGRGLGRGGAFARATTAEPTDEVALDPTPKVEEGAADSDADSDSDGAPEAVSSKTPAGLVDFSPSADAEGQGDADPVVPKSSTDAMELDVPAAGPSGGAIPPSQPQTKLQTKPMRRPPPQPKRPPRNPFASRTSLLRNLLLPEIRMTVSNLSQAIHFLVDNDFLDNVELKPGQANEKMIEVVGEQSAQNRDSGAKADPPDDHVETTTPSL